MANRIICLLLALMCENVNAAPGGGIQPVERENVDASVGHSGLSTQPGIRANQSIPAIPAVPAAAPFTIGHPMCQTGFTVAQRFDQRNSAGTIIKSVWVRKCVRVPKIIYRRI